MASIFHSGQKTSEKNQFFFKKVLTFSLIIGCLLLQTASTPYWGFWAHKHINRLAIFRLPPEMQVFFKKYIDFLTENAVNPDKRRYAVVGEAERHFIDLDVYGDRALMMLPKHWPAAVRKMGEDSLRKHGIVPWHVQAAASQLTAAFRQKDARRILRISADLGHYIADAHVPLHTTRNYNGQLTGQDGIHGFWESRLPELFANHYDMWLGPASYRKDIAVDIWKVIESSHAAMDSVLLFERQLTAGFKPDQKYSFELRNNVLTRTQSREFSEKYHRMLAGQVERRMAASVQMVSDIWYTCWVNAGQPNLSLLAGNAGEVQEGKAEAAEHQSWLQRLLHVRPESDN
ncbi:zinc dependent phospholipase C family protein [Dyadobacter sp. CY261]|uniref:zinc dependent phospholipase C family protein n=1 Tax=Dyadobacter sp. CY261 TaxID=2907203 RepID=UPI001F29000A|nr:zinc dependent phospholipase C family protein [Dyadobacter sp. CY261]MCF0068962.1 zinc dependent phospholipase C family protein [Dyadobacter sp. CY261]